MTNKIYNIIFSDEFLTRKSKKKHGIKNRIERGTRLIAALLGSSAFNHEMVDLLTRGKNFDRFASIKFPINGSEETLTVPLISLYFANINSGGWSSDLRYTRREWKEHPDPNGSSCPEFIAPLMSSAFHNCKEMEVLLANPQIDPNPSKKFPKFKAIERDDDERPQLNLTNNISIDVFNKVLQKLSIEISHSRASEARIANVPAVKLCVQNCLALMDAGAFIRKDNTQFHDVVLNNAAIVYQPIRQKYYDMKARAENILNGVVCTDNITLADIKHLYGLQRLDELFENALNSPELAHKLQELRPEMPNYLSEELAAAYKIITKNQQKDSWIKFVSSHNNSANNISGRM